MLIFLNQLSLKLHFLILINLINELVNSFTIYWFELSYRNSINRAPFCKWNNSEYGEVAKEYETQRYKSLLNSDIKDTDFCIQNSFNYDASLLQNKNIEEEKHIDQSKLICN